MPQSYLKYIVLLTIVALLVAGCGEPLNSDDNGNGSTEPDYNLAFSAGNDTNSLALYRMGPQYEEPVRLTNASAGSAYNPVWLPDAGSLVFTFWDGEIYLLDQLDLSSGDENIIRETLDEPYYGEINDFEQIVYTLRSSQNQRADLFRYDFEFNRETDIDPTRSANFYEPVFMDWSPNHENVLLRTYQITVTDSTNQLILVDRGGNIQLEEPLVDTNVNSFRIFRANYLDNGNNLLIHGDEPGGEQLYMGPTGGNISTPVTHLSDAYDLEFSLSPEEDQVAYSYRTGSDDYAVYVKEVDEDDDTVRISEEGVSSYTPQWSPDGKRIAFAAYDDEDNSTSIMLYHIEEDSLSLMVEMDTSYLLLGPWSPEEVE